MYGGYSSLGDALYNTINVNNGRIPILIGGYSREGDALNNTINISGGDIGNADNYAFIRCFIIGGYSLGGQYSSDKKHSANNNVINISESPKIIGNICGGYAATYNGMGAPSESSSIKNVANNNTINILGSPSGNNWSIYGGHAYGGTSSENTINIFGNPSGIAIIYGGYESYASTSSGNTLNIYTKDLTAQNVEAFQNINFYIPVGAVNGDTLLTLTDTNGTNLSGVAIKAGVEANNTTLKNGDVINLLTNANGLTTDATTTYGKLTEGVSVTYDLAVTQSGNSIIAKIGGTNPTPTPIQNIIPTPTPNVTPAPIPNVTPQKLNPQIDIIDRSAISPINTVLTVVQNDVLPSYMIGDVDFEEIDTSSPTGGNSNTKDKDVKDDAKEIADVPNPEPKGWEIFGDMGGGSLRTKTGNGSYVDTKTTNFDLGIARNIPHGGAGKLTVAPIIDYARGSYDSYLSDGTHGTGNTKYIAGGFMGRNTWNNGFYLEGSFRIGKVKTDFASNDLDTTDRYGRITYDTSATTLAGHLKVGKNFRLNKNNILDVYAAYYHAHQGSMDANLYPSGDRYKISSADSGRFKIGYRLTTRTSKISRIYTGLAYQYEYANGITSTYLSKNISTSGGNEKGSSGMLEVGWLIKPLKNNPWAVDINATGWIGHQRGVTAMAKVVKSF